jgi:hypothetical protein
MSEIKIVGLSGKAGSGKDYIAANFIRPKFGYYPFSLSWHLKVNVVNINNFSYEDVFYIKPPEVRSTLQFEGTEVYRAQCGEDIWINKMFTWFRVLHESWGINKFVVTDVRFPNEVMAIKNHGGSVIRIVADSRCGGTNLTDTARVHSSETSLDGYPLDSYDAVLYNEVHNEHRVEQDLVEIFTNLNLT